MNEIGELALSGALIALVALEVTKWVLRKYRYGEGFDFPPKFYTLMIPFLTFCGTVVLGLVGLGPEEPFSIRGLISWGLAILGELILYNAGVGPLKEYSKRYATKEQEEEAPVG